MTQAIRIVTYNIHKGFSQFNQRMVLHELRDQLRGIHADLVFLQEVVGAHDLHAEKHVNWPKLPNTSFSPNPSGMISLMARTPSIPRGITAMRS